MTDIPADAEGLSIVIEVEGATKAVADDLRIIFDGDDEDVVFSHAFGGVDIVAIVTALSKSTLGKLIDYFARSKTDAGKTTLTIGKQKIEMKGFSRQDIEALLASENFQKTVRAARK